MVETFRRPDRSFLTPPAPRPLAPETVLDIGHETLIRQWRRLAGWVDAEAESAAIYRRLVETARLWRGGQAGLWGSPDLDLALNWRSAERRTAVWAARYGGDFELAMEFLAASEARRRTEEEVAERDRVEREKQKRVRQRSLLLTVGLVLALTLATLAVWELLQARTLARQVRAGLLVSVAAATGREHPQRSLLLGAEAVDLTPDPASPSGEAARELLAALLGEVGGQALAGHTDEVQAVSFTSNGRWIATASDDGTVRLWNALDHESAPVVLHAGDALRTLAVSPDDRWLAAAGVAGVVHLWELAAIDPSTASPGSPPAPRELNGHRDSIVSLAWSPDGGLLASGSEDHDVRLWRVASPAAPEVPLGDAGRRRRRDLQRRLQPRRPMAGRRQRRQRGATLAPRRRRSAGRSGRPRRPPGQHRRGGVQPRRPLAGDRRRGQRRPPLAARRSGRRAHRPHRASQLGERSGSES